MKITFDVEDIDLPYLLFMDQEDWDRHKRFMENERVGPKMTPHDDPSSFPCVALEAGMHFDPNGPDVQHYAFIYNATLSDG